MPRFFFNAALVGFVVVTSSTLLMHANAVLAFLPKINTKCKNTGALPMSLTRDPNPHYAILKRLQRPYILRKEYKCKKTRCVRSYQKPNIITTQKHVLFPPNTSFYYAVVSLYFYIAACFFLLYTCM